MIKKLLIDYVEVSNLFNEEYKQTMQLIEAGETHLDNLAEGFTEADRVLLRLMFQHPQTNADRIRAMSDEELAAYLVYHNPYSTEEFCLKWLRQPVKDGEGDG